MGEEGSNQAPPVNVLNVLSSTAAPWKDVYTNTQAPTHTKKREKTPGLAERDLTECDLDKCDLSECDVAEQNSWIC